MSIDVPDEDHTDRLDFPGSTKSVQGLTLHESAGDVRCRWPRDAFGVCANNAKVQLICTRRAEEAGMFLQ